MPRGRARRATGADDHRYLIWKIREAERGRIPVGPPPARKGEPADVKILQLRLASEVVERIDDVWRTHGIKIRIELIRGPTCDTSRTHIGAAGDRGRELVEGHMAKRPSGCRPADILNVCNQRLRNGSLCG